MINIRAAVPDDAPEIARIHVASWRETYTGLVPQHFLDALDSGQGSRLWRERVADPAAIVLVAEEQGSPAGFAAGGPVLHPVTGYDAELAAIYLLRRAHRQGGGRSLLRAFAARIVQRGYTSLVVWALEANPACGFYQRMGGIPVARQTIEIGGHALPEVAFGWPDARLLCPERP